MARGRIKAFTVALTEDQALRLRDLCRRLHLSYSHVLQDFTTAILDVCEGLEAGDELDEEQRRTVAEHAREIVMRRQRRTNADRGKAYRIRKILGI